MMIIQLILILIKRKMMKNQRKYIGQKTAKKYLEQDESETDERDQRKHPDSHKILEIQKIGHDDYSVATDIDLEYNVTKNTDLSTSTLAARQLTENPDDMVDSEEEMSSDDLTITGDYSDYDILEEEKDTITENDHVWFQKIQIWRGRVLLIPYSKKKRIVNI